MSGADVTGTDLGVRLPVADAGAVRRSTLELIRGDGRAVLGVLLLTCAASAAGLAGPWLLGLIVDEVEGGAATATIDRLALAIVGFAAAQLLLTRFARLAAHRVGERFLARLREQFVDRTLGLPTTVVERAGTGDLMMRSTGDVAVVGYTLRDAAPEVFVSAVRAVFIVGAVFVLHPLLGLLALAGAPLVWWVSRWYLHRARTAYLAEGAAKSELSESLAATTEGARTVEAFGLQRRRIDTGDASIAAAHATRVRTLFLRSFLYPVVDVAHAMPVAAMVFLGGLFYTRDVVTLGAVIAASLYMWQLVDPVDRILMWMEQLQQSAASLARIIGVGQVGGVVAAARGVPVDDRIEVSDVRFSYTGDHDVLHGVDLTVQPGERLAIVGPSGAGKSTLGRLLAGVDRPRRGSVTVGRVPVADLAPEVLRERILLVTQEHHIFLGTLRDNVSIAAPSADDEAMLAALAAVGADWAGVLPDGLDTELGSHRTQLDAAQAQQVALARVVLADPHTVVLDEATALLDPTTARQTERSLAAALAGRTVIAIAHRLHTAHDADRIAVMDEGTIVEVGGHGELVAAGGHYGALWRSWHGGSPSRQPGPLLSSKQNPDRVDR
ncbi:MAG: ABC transporter ATP-binding protein [Actinomycetota bacterium]